MKGRSPEETSNKDGDGGVDETRMIAKQTVNHRETNGSRHTDSLVATANQARRPVHGLPEAIGGGT